MKQFQRSVPIFVLLWTVIVAQECYLDRRFYIKSIVGGLSLDGTDTDHVKIMYFDGQAQQRWALECGDEPGHFFIVNEYNGLVLEAPTYDVFLSTKSSSLNQQWTLNWNGTIHNVGAKQNLDVNLGDFFSGNTVNLYYNTGTPQQKWNLQEVY